MLTLISLLLRFKHERIMSPSGFMLCARELLVCSPVGVLVFCHSRTKCFPTTKFEMWNRAVITLLLEQIVKHGVMMECVCTHFRTIFKVVDGM
jgi:hypothetical protein